MKVTNNLEFLANKKIINPIIEWAIFETWSVNWSLLTEVWDKFNNIYQIQQYWVQFKILDEASEWIVRNMAINNSWNIDLSNYDDTTDEIGWRLLDDNEYCYILDQDDDNENWIYVNYDSVLYLIKKFSISQSWMLEINDNKIYLNIKGTDKIELKAWSWSLNYNKKKLSDLDKSTSDWEDIYKFQHDFWHLINYSVYDSNNEEIMCNKNSFDDYLEVKVKENTDITDFFINYIN